MNKNKIVFLGYSPVNLPLLMDVCHDAFGTNEFLVFQNIQSQEEVLNYNNQEYYNYSVLDMDSEIKPDGLPILLGVTNVIAKIAVHEFFLKKHKIFDEQYISLIHPKAYVSRSALVDKSVIIEPKAIISSQTTIGFGVTVKRGANIGHHNTIGNFTSINPGCILSGNVTIGEKCTLGTGSVFRDSITVGENTVIGMGSVVTKNIPANSIAYGNPCKVIKTNLK